jgi:hypothetical protein
VKQSLTTWFRQIWPFDPGRKNVLRGYAGLAREPELLTDIALRGHLFSSAHVVKPDGGTDEFATWINIGRQELALEILECAHMRPDQLREYIEMKPTTERNHGR